MPYCPIWELLHIPFFKSKGFTITLYTYFYPKTKKYFFHFEPLYQISGFKGVLPNRRDNGIDSGILETLLD